MRIVAAQTFEGPHEPGTCRPASDPIGSKPIPVPPSLIRKELLSYLPKISEQYIEKRKAEKPKAIDLPAKTPNKITDFSKEPKPKRTSPNKGKTINRAPKYPWTTLKVGETFFIPHKDHKSLGPTRRHADKRYGIQTEALVGRFRGCPGVYIKRVK